MRAKCIYPTELKILTDEGDKTYSSLSDAVPVLRELGIQVRLDEREKMEHKLARYRRSTTKAKRMRSVAKLLSADALAFFDNYE